MADVSVPRSCEQCRTEFIAKPNTKGRFCSHLCYGRSVAQPKDILFWKRVKKSEGCWLWAGPLTSTGYGDFYTSRYFRCLAHRFSYELAHGSIPQGMEVRHKCDNPPCVNPDHLEMGTHLENMRDSVARNRNAKGERQGCAKLTVYKVQEARTLYASGNFTYQELGHRYQVDRQVISKAIRRLTWAHVD